MLCGLIHLHKIRVEVDVETKKLLPGRDETDDRVSDGAELIRNAARVSRT